MQSNRARITFTVTALPKHLYLCVSLTPSVHPSGKPCNRSHSVGVNLLIFISLISHFSIFSFPVVRQFASSTVVGRYSLWSFPLKVLSLPSLCLISRLVFLPNSVLCSPSI